MVREVHMRVKSRSPQHAATELSIKRSRLPDTDAFAGRSRLTSASPPRAGRERRGFVCLVGAGPGDPELLTLRALRRLRRADVVLYDHLVAPEILALARRGAQRVFVGKERGSHALPQQEINRLMVTWALRGRTVVRLKGGDPFVFGRGGEELEALAAHGIPFEVVPGITAANGVAAYAGIPLTHRDHAHACVLVTGHQKDGSLNLDWEALARPQQTLVIYMGLATLSIICRKLIAHGLPMDTAAAIVQHGASMRQRVVIGTLATLPGLVAATNLAPPTLIIVGEVVKLRERLAWFDPHSGHVTPATPSVVAPVAA